MKIFFLILNATIMTSAYAALPIFKVTPGIVGGIEVSPAMDDTSFVVSIGGGCACTIVDEKWILTAANREEIFEKKLTAGSINLMAADRII